LKANITVLYARFLDFGGDKGTDKVKGTQLFYQMEGPIEEGAIGHPIPKAFLKDMNSMVLLPAPGVYEATFEPKIVGGKIEMKLKDIGKPVAARQGS